MKNYAIINNGKRVIALFLMSEDCAAVLTFLNQRYKTLNYSVTYTSKQLAEVVED